MTQQKDVGASELAGIGRSGGSSNVLFLIATETLRTLKSESKQSQAQAMVSTVFAVAAVETFIFELGEEAFASQAPNPDGELLRGLGVLTRDMEESRFSLSTKITWIARYLTGRPLDRGSRLFQDFDLLVRLRNTIIHLKDSEEFLSYQDGSLQTKGTPKVISQLESRGLIKRPYKPSWIVAVSTHKIGEWSCYTAVQIVDAVIDMLPAPHFKEWIRNLHRAFSVYRPTELSQ